MDTTRKFPRSLEEAFGPGHRGGIYEERKPMDKADRSVITACAVALVVFAFMVLA
jgi:hypothetical protein